MGIEQFLDAVDGNERTLAVLNRSSPRPVLTMLEELFADQPVTVEEASVPDGDEDLAVLLDDGAVVATSPLSELLNAILLVNSDLYVTGTRSLSEVELPDVLSGMADVPFRLYGYPESEKEKFLLIVVSRYVERRAWEGDGGTLRASFQYLSRINDERGTRRVYERLATTDTDVHVYGVPDWRPGPEFDVTMHGGHTPDFRRSWFVVYDAPAGEESVALLAREVEPSLWEGYWTHREDVVADVTRYVERNL